MGIIFQFTDFLNACATGESLLINIAQLGVYPEEGSCENSAEENLNCLLILM